MSQVYKADINGDGSTPTPQGFLDYEGVKHLWSKVSMKDYPNNETLAAVINAIDETKADKSELFSGSWNDLSDRPFSENEKVEITHETIEYNYAYINLNTEVMTELLSKGSFLISVNNIEYEMKETSRENDSMGYENIYYTNEQCPIKIRVNTAMYEITVYASADAIEYPFTLSIYKNDLKQLDSKFIGPDIARVSDIPVDTVTNSELHPIAKSGSWNDLEDKPFGEINLFEIIYENSRVSGGPAIFEDDYSTLPLSSIIPDETYIVTVDGVDYIGVAEWWEDTSSDGGNGVRLFGNFSDFNDTPISIGSYGNYIYFSFVDDSIPYSVKITHVTKNIQVLDDKFISDNIARVSDIPNLSTYEFITTADIDAICGASIIAANEVTY